MPKAYFVIGPEASGTKITTKLFLLSGCFGDDTDVQRLDRAETGESVKQLAGGRDIVYRRSVPHKKSLPALYLTAHMLEAEADYKVIWVFCFRDWFANMLGKINGKHHGSYESASYAMRFEWAYIAPHMILDNNFIMFNTSVLFANPARAIRGLEYWTGRSFPPRAVSMIYDADEKYYKGDST